MNPANDATPIQRGIVVPFEPGPDGAAGAVGAAVSDLGQKGAEFGVQMAAAKQQADLVTARLTASKQLDDLSDQFRTDPDPATAPDRYAAAAQKIGDQAGANLYGNASREFQGDFGQMAESRRVAVKDMAFTRQVQGANASLDDTIETQSRIAAFAPNDAVRAGAIAAISKGVNGLVDTGMLSATDGERKMQTARERLALYDGKAAVFQNPAAAMKSLASPGFLPDLDPLSRVELQHSAEAEVHVRAREARMDLANARLLAGQDAGQLHDVIASGLPVAQSVIDQAKSSAIASQDPRAMARLAGLLKAQGYSDSFRGASTQDLVNGLSAIETQANKTGANDAMATAMTAMRKRVETQTTALTHDPLMWANDQGVTQITPLKFDNSAADNQMMQQRVRQAQQVSQHYGVPVSPLTQTEIETVKTRLDKYQDPDMRLATLQNIVHGFGTSAVPLLAKVGDADPAIANAGALVASGPAYVGTARDVLSGAAMLSAKANENLRPGSNGLAAAGVNKLLPAFVMAPNDRTPVLSGAQSLYAAMAARQGLTGADAASGQGQLLMKKALQLAAGARFDADGTQWGGITTYNSGTGLFGFHTTTATPVLVPGNIKSDDFEDLLHQFRPADLAAASVSGKPPSWEGAAAPDDLLRRTWLVSNMGGTYGLSTTNPANGVVTHVKDSAGRPFAFRFNTALVAMQSRTKAPAP